MSRIIQRKPKRLAGELHAQFAESAKLEHLSSVALAKDEAIKTNLRGLGYGS
jgi:hypothetical protein